MRANPLAAEEAEEASSSTEARAGPTQGVQAKEFILPKELLEQDCVISLSKMKTHALERITGAVKNSYGFIYGFHKAKGHTQYPSADRFARMLIDLKKGVGSTLYVMDGIEAMEGGGVAVVLSPVFLVENFGTDDLGILEQSNPSGE